MIGQQLDFVKVLDFGLVRDVASGARLTGEGMIAGTPAYLAPETAAKNITDARSDIYSLGCVAYWMLTGQLVFDGETSAAMMAAHLRDQVTPPSKRTEAWIPPDLDALVVSCLAKNPDERPQTMEELRALLSAISVEQLWTEERARSWWTAHLPDVIREATEIKSTARV
jgi:serine/threonine-protein kinase